MICAWCGKEIKEGEKYVRIQYAVGDVYLHKSCYEKMCGGA